MRYHIFAAITDTARLCLRLHTDSIWGH